MKQLPCTAGNLQAQVRAIARTVARGDREAADDLEQDVLLVALRSSPRDESARHSWLWAVSKNQLRFKAFRKLRRPKHVELDELVLEPQVCPTEDPVLAAGRAELSELLLSLSQKLPPLYREAVELRVIDSLPPRIVAERLGVSVDTARARVRKGIAQLRKEAVALAHEDDPRWQWSILVGGLKGPGHSPKRALWCVAALAIVTVTGISVFRLDSGAVAPDGHVDFAAEAEQANPIGSVAMVSPVTGYRATLGQDSEVRISVRDDAGLALEAATVIIRDTGGRVLDVELNSDGDALVEHLEPGSWTAWVNSRWQGAVDLEPGPQEWDMVIQLNRTVSIKVYGLDGEPAPSVPIYARDGLHGPVCCLGNTDEAGLLEDVVAADAAWVAAQGPPGQCTPSLLVGQPLTASNGYQLKLTLEPVDVLWSEIQFDERLAQRVAVVRGRVLNSKAHVSTSPAGGIRGSSGWLPTWRDEQGRYGVRKKRGIALEARDTNGVLLWVSPRNTARRPIPLVLQARSPITVTGTLLDSKGCPLAGERLHFLAYGRGDEEVASTLTDENGEFHVEDFPAVDIAAAGYRLKTTDSIGIGEEGQIDFGILQVRAGRVELALEPTPYRWRVTQLDPTRSMSSDSITAKAVHSDRVSYVDSGATRVEVDRHGETPLLFEAIGSPDPLALIVYGLGSGEVALGDAKAGSLRGELDPSFRPARGYWQEVRSGCVVSALIDGRSGEVSSPPLPPGEWSLQLSVRTGEAIRSGPHTVTAGDVTDIGYLRNERGTLRVGFPDEWREGSDRVQVEAVHERPSNSSPTYHRHSWRTGSELPEYFDLELPTGDYMLLLTAGTDSRHSNQTVQCGVATLATAMTSEPMISLVGWRSLLAKYPGVTFEWRSPTDGIIGSREPLNNFWTKFLKIRLPSLFADSATTTQLVLRDGGGQILLTHTVERHGVPRPHINLMRTLREGSGDD